MKKQIYQIELAGHPIKYAFTFPETQKYFTRWICISDGEPDISASQESIEYARQFLPADSENGYVEYRLMISMTSAELLKYDACVFHSVSFFWKDKAWLLTAPSGTGKTTQLQNWRQEYPNEIKIMNGDMPVLERRKDGSIWVHPSPWNGKEKMGTALSAPLGGIVYLEQGDKNCVKIPKTLEMIKPILFQFLVCPETEPQLRALLRILDSMLTSVPVWIFSNLGDTASTALLRDTIAKAAGGEDDAL